MKIMHGDIVSVPGGTNRRTRRQFYVILEAGNVHVQDGIVESPGLYLCRKFDIEYGQPGDIRSYGKTYPVHGNMTGAIKEGHINIDFERHKNRL